jgi:hypothetical protein
LCAGAAKQALNPLILLCAAAKKPDIAGLFNFSNFF